jgi:hypothetical protein
MPEEAGIPFYPNFRVDKGSKVPALKRFHAPTTHVHDTPRMPP